MNNHLAEMTAALSQSAGVLVRTDGRFKRVRMVLHPSHQAVARRIDELNASRTNTLSAPEVCSAKSATRPITRLDVLSALAAADMTASQIAQQVLGHPDEGATHRICAVLARETARGLVQPPAGSGRGAVRSLTETGRAMLLQLQQQFDGRQDLKRAEQLRERRQASRETREAAFRDARCNGVFDYARKIHLSLRGATAQ